MVVIEAAGDSVKVTVDGAGGRPFVEQALSGFELAGAASLRISRVRCFVPFLFQH
jgi:hypothetical protein